MIIKKQDEKMRVGYIVSAAEQYIITCTANNNWNYLVSH